MKYVDGLYYRKCIILVLIVFDLGVVPFLYYKNNAEDINIYLHYLTAATVFFFSYAAYKFQEQIHEFNRLNRVPHLNITRDELEKNKVIEIKNMSSFVATDVYIGSFLFSGDGQKKTPLLEEKQQQIGPCYPVRQCNVLKSDFREKSNEEDKKEYGSTLVERITKFIPENSGNPIYLTIGLKAKIMEDNELLLFFYECTSYKDNLYDGFTAKHFSAKEKMYKDIRKAVTDAYKKYKI